MPTRSIEASLQVAIQHHQAGKLAEAAAIYRQILVEKPDHADALHLLGVVAAQAGKYDLAVKTIRRAIAANPSAPEYHNNLGNALRDKGQLDEAIEAYRQALSLRHDYAEARNNLATTAEQQGRTDLSVEARREAVRLKGDSPVAHYNLGVAYAADGRLDDAIEEYRRAFRLNPEFVEPYNNMGIAYAAKGDYDAAIKAYREAIRVSPEFPDPHVNLASVWLLKGDFEHGWPEYEWRWKLKDAPLPNRNFVPPQWKGEDLRGRTILIYCEQGFGDTIQFVRFLPLVAHLGARVIFVALPELMRLLEGFPGIAQLVPPGDLPGFHCHFPLLSLPLAFGTQLSTIPAPIAYLQPDPTMAEAWSDKVKQLGAGLKVGLSWAGRPTHANDRDRSLTLSQLAPLAKAGVTFFSLQKGDSASQAAQAPAGMKLVDLTADLHDFADTAALISALDMVISVDTAVVHLAAALGKPTWVLTPFNPDWRWLLGRDDSPWYPTMRLFRQKSRGDWSGPIASAAEALGRVVDLRTERGV